MAWGPHLRRPSRRGERLDRDRGGGAGPLGLHARAVRGEYNEYYTFAQRDADSAAVVHTWDSWRGSTDGSTIPSTRTTRTTGRTMRRTIVRRARPTSTASATTAGTDVRLLPVVILFGDLATPSVFGRHHPSCATGRVKARGPSPPGIATLAPLGPDRGGDQSIASFGYARCLRRV